MIPSECSLRRGARLSALGLGIVASLVACNAHERAPTPPHSASAPGPLPSADLRGPEAFAAIGDRDARARAIFGEMVRVISHPRCVNCHPRGDSPAQGDTGRRHDPPVARGPHDDGLPALACGSCHQDKNLELARVPGAPNWHLAPRAMAWAGRTPAQICAQIQDRARNGGRTVAEIVEHVTHDPLVGWAWSPGHGRTPAPGTQAKFGALAAAWAASGAACPEGR